MKRGKPLQRRTPLQTRTPLRAGKQLAKGAPPNARTPIKAKRTKPRRRSRDTDHGIPWPDVRLVIWTRAGGRCEGCGKPVSLAAMEGHHRLTRRLGPDCPCNALALCRDCHHGPEGHGGPARAMELGRILSRHLQDPPSTQPVDLHGVGRVLLTCTGDHAPALD